MSKYAPLIQRLMMYAQDSVSIRAVFVIGSQARSLIQADEYSDLDILIIAKDPSYFFDQDQWLDALGPYYISFVEGTIGGGKERRVLFEGGLDVDFVIMSEDFAKNALQSATVRKVFERGYLVLLDKLGLSPDVPQSTIAAPRYTVPTETEFINHINDFWYHAVWTVKKLLRGELWAAKFCLDGYMKTKLRWLIELHTQAQHDFTYDTWHDGRFLDTWADPRAVDGLNKAFATYRREDILPALQNTMELFHWIALETCDKTNYTYPYKAEEYARDWIKQATKQYK